MSADWSNALAAMPVESDFVADLARAVSNSGDLRSGETWLLNFASDYLRKHGLPDGPLAAFDFAIYDFEALIELWPAVRHSITLHPSIGADPGADLARFLVERLPALWDRESWRPHTAPVTRTLVLADRIDTLVGMFMAGNKPNGSKDPYALRRAANHLLMQFIFPVMRERKAA